MDLGHAMQLQACSMTTDNITTERNLVQHDSTHQEKIKITNSYLSSSIPDPQDQ